MACPNAEGTSPIIKNPPAKRLPKLRPLQTLDRVFMPLFWSFLENFSSLSFIGLRRLGLHLEEEQHSKDDNEEEQDAQQDCDGP